MKPCRRKQISDNSVQHLLHRDAHLWGFSVDSLQKLTRWPEYWERFVRRGMFWQYLFSSGFMVQCDNIRASDTWLHSLSLPRRCGILKHLRFHHVNLNQTPVEQVFFFTLPGESINTWPSGTIHSCKVAIYFQLSITWQIITQSIQLSCATCTTGNNMPAENWKNKKQTKKNESTSCSCFRSTKKQKHTRWLTAFAAEVEMGQSDDGQ